MIDIQRTLRLLDVEAESNFVQADAIDAINYLLRENARLREVLKPFVKTLELNCTEADPDDFFIDQEGALRVSDLRAARAAIPGDVKAEAACPELDEAP